MNLSVSFYTFSNHCIASHLYFDRSYWTIFVVQTYFVNEKTNTKQFNVKLILEARENTFFHIDLRQSSPLLRFPIKTHKRMQIRPQNIYDSICICGRLVFCIRLGMCYFLFSLEISILFEYFVQRKMATFLMNDKEKKLGAWLMPIF